MNRVIIVLVLLVVGVVGLGFYRGWWSIASDSDPEKIHLNLTVDKDKIKEDEQKALKKVQDLGYKAPKATEKSTDATAPFVGPSQN